MMHLQQLIYVSRPNNLHLEDIKAIEESALRNNLEHGITGVLVFNGNFFLQMLEGQREAVSKIFTRIVNDPRHTSVELVTCRNIDQRSFSNWTMAFIPIGMTSKHVRSQYSKEAMFDPYTMPSDHLSDFLEALKDQEFCK